MDMARVQASAMKNGDIEILGPPTVRSGYSQLTEVLTRLSCVVARMRSPCCRSRP